MTRRLRCGAQLRYNARTCTLVLQGRLDFTKRYMLHRLICLLRRQHDYSLKEGHGHVFLFCRRCGVRTPGWETSPRFRVVEPASEPRQATRSDPWAAAVPPGEPAESAGFPELRLILDEPVSTPVRTDTLEPPLRLLLAESEGVLPLGDLVFDCPPVGAPPPIVEQRLLLDQP